MPLFDYRCYTTNEHSLKFICVWVRTWGTFLDGKATLFLVYFGWTECLPGVDPFPEQSTPWAQARPDAKPAEGPFEGDELFLFASIVDWNTRIERMQLIALQNANYCSGWIVSTQKNIRKPLLVLSWKSLFFSQKEVSTVFCSHHSTALGGNLFAARILRTMVSAPRPSMSSWAVTRPGGGGLFGASFGGWKTWRWVFVLCFFLFSFVFGGARASELLVFGYVCSSFFKA